MTTINRSFLFWLFALLLFYNDFFWKSSFHNAFTGKLSDVAGLALWVLFWEAWLPQRFCGALYVFSAVFFVWFKSPFSEAFLHLLNLSRVVDYTDLWALLGLVLLYFLPKTPLEKVKRWQPTLVGSVVALFLFGATSKGPPPHIICKDKLVLAFKMPKDSLLNFFGRKFNTGNVFTQLDTIGLEYILQDSVFYEKHGTDVVELRTTIRAFGKNRSTFTLDAIRVGRYSPAKKVNKTTICSDVQAVLRKKLRMP